jgi:hypothetical protein
VRSNLLASYRDGCTEALMMAHGFPSRWSSLCASAYAERIIAGGKQMRLRGSRCVGGGRFPAARLFLAQIDMGRREFINTGPNQL